MLIYSSSLFIISLKLRNFKLYKRLASIISRTVPRHFEDTLVLLLLVCILLSDILNDICTSLCQYINIPGTM